MEGWSNRDSASLPFFGTCKKGEGFAFRVYDKVSCFGFIMLNGLWFMVHDLWFIRTPVYGLWFIAYGSWSMVHGLWFMAYG